MGEHLIKIVSICSANSNPESNNPYKNTVVQHDFHIIAKAIDTIARSIDNVIMCINIILNF